MRQASAALSDLAANGYYCHFMDRAQSWSHSSGKLLPWKFGDIRFPYAVRQRAHLVHRLIFFFNVTSQSGSGLPEQPFQLVGLLLELLRVGLRQAPDIFEFPSDAGELLEVFDAKQLPIWFIAGER